jgi:hypothetical protein
LELDEPYDQFGGFILVEPGDNPASLEAESGCLITTGLFIDAKFGDPDFMPCFEWLEHHAQAHCYEMLFVMSDDGFGAALFVPNSPDIDPELLTFCRTYATPAIEVTCAIYTASTGKLDVLRRLVEAGADLDKEATGGYTALDSASTLPVLKYLRSVMAAA